LSVDERNQRSVLELTAGDRPGLLSDVGKVLMEERMQMHDAKIMTVGERAEDVFYITDFAGRPLNAGAQQRLRDRLMQALDRRQAA
jgi:[protein-PII] uridylyltransferase